MLEAPAPAARLADCAGRVMAEEATRVPATLLDSITDCTTVAWEGEEAAVLTAKVRVTVLGVPGAGLPAPARERREVPRKVLGSRLASRPESSAGGA